MRSFPYGVADGDGEGDAFSFVEDFCRVETSFLAAAASESVDFLVVSVDDFLVYDFLVLVSVFAGAVVVVAVSVLLVLQEARSPAPNMTVME